MALSQVETAVTVRKSSILFQNLVLTYQTTHSHVGEEKGYLYYQHKGNPETDMSF
jgi:hypothetical protein